MCEPETEIECAACDSVPIYMYIHYMGKFLFLFFLQNFGTFFLIPSRSKSAMWGPALTTWDENTFAFQFIPKMSNGVKVKAVQDCQVVVDQIQRNYFFMDLSLCMEALPCWKGKDPYPNCGYNVGITLCYSIKISFYWNLETSKPWKTTKIRPT